MRETELIAEEAGCRSITLLRTADLSFYSSNDCIHSGTNVGSCFRMLFHSNTMVQAILLLVITVLTVLTTYVLLPSKRSLPDGSRDPPGPPGKPFVGNLLDIPKRHSWIQFKARADRYGPLMRLTLAGSEHYIVSTEKVANDLLRERGSLYSSRAQAPASAQLLSNNLRPVLLPYNGESVVDTHQRFY